MVIHFGGFNFASLWTVSSAIYQKHNYSVPAGHWRSEGLTGETMKITMTILIFMAGIGQLCVLIASSLVPFQLKWKTKLAVLSRLHRQMYWVYGGYVVLSIVAFRLISLLNATELARGLARGVCAYVAVFWGIRLALQAVFDVKEHLQKWWLKLGYCCLIICSLSSLFCAATSL